MASVETEVDEALEEAVDVPASAKAGRTVTRGPGVDEQLIRADPSCAWCFALKLLELGASGPYLSRVTQLVHADFGGMARPEAQHDLSVWDIYIKQQVLAHLGRLGDAPHLVTRETEHELVHADDAPLYFLQGADLRLPEDNVVLARLWLRHCCDATELPLPLTAETHRALKDVHDAPMCVWSLAFANDRVLGRRRGKHKTHYKQKKHVTAEEVRKGVYCAKGGVWFNTLTNQAYDQEADAVNDIFGLHPVNELYDGHRPLAPVYRVNGVEVYAQGILEARKVSERLRKRHEQLPTSQRQRLSKKQAWETCLTSRGFWSAKTRKRRRARPLGETFSKVQLHKFDAELRDMLGPLLENEELYLDLNGTAIPSSATVAVRSTPEDEPGFVALSGGLKMCSPSLKTTLRVLLRRA